jgi:hypothetical protein
MRAVGTLVGLALVLLVLFACRPRTQATPEPSDYLAIDVPDAPASAASAASAVPRGVPAGGPVTPVARVVHLEGTGEADDPLDYGIAVDGLPAVTEDGATVAAVTPDEGLLMHLRPTFVAIDSAADRVVRKTSLVTESEASALFALETGASPKLADAAKKKTEVSAAAHKRLADVQAWLDARKWRHMAELVVAEDAGARGSAGAGLDPGGGVTVDFDGVHVTERAPGGVTLFDRSFPAWVPAVRRLPPPIGNECHFEPRVSGAAVDPARGALLVVVAQIEVGGGDWCNEPASVHAFHGVVAAAAP